MQKYSHTTQVRVSVCLCRLLESLSAADDAAAAQRLHLQRLAAAAAAMRYSPYHFTAHPACLPIPGRPRYDTVTSAALITSLLPVSYSLLYTSQQRHHQSFPIYITQTKIADKKRKKRHLSGQTAQTNQPPAWPPGHPQLPLSC